MNYEDNKSRQGIDRRDFLRLIAAGTLVTLISPEAVLAKETTVVEQGYAIPKWWVQTRSLYCPAFCGGAGSALMQYWEPGLKDKESPRINSFHELPKLLDEAQRLGSNVIYLVDFWEGGYFNKGDYLPREDLGGAKAFREGIDAVHKRGGKIIVYFEAFIVSRTTSELGRTKGAQWAIQKEDGSYYGYIDDMQYYQMWPGKGSGWSDCLATLGERYLKDYDVDGFHLDSYGYQKGWIDHHPAHPDGRDPKAFNRSATALVREFRERIRRVNPEAIVMLEGNDCPWLMPVSDGTQAWGLDSITDKSWAKKHSYKVFTSSRNLELMEKILASGWCISLSPWWLRPMPDDALFESLQTFELPPKEEHWWETFPPRDIMGRMWWCYDVLWANGAIKRGEIDLDRFERIIRRFPAQIDRAAWNAERKAEWRETAESLINRVKKLDLTHAKTPTEHLREVVLKAQSVNTSE